MEAKWESPLGKGRAGRAEDAAADSRGRRKSKAKEHWAGVPSIGMRLTGREDGQRSGTWGPLAMVAAVTKTAERNYKMSGLPFCHGAPCSEKLSSAHTPVAFSPLGNELTEQ